MKIPFPMERWLDVRPHEIRPLLLSFLGAFFVIGFMILARSLREALYLTTFEVRTLPYITAASVILGIPTVVLFTRLLSRVSTSTVFRWLLLVLGGGLILLWPTIQLSAFAVVGFYLWTYLASLVLTAGFWLIVAEHFPLRGAKRLFGFISAGGTAGAMVFGMALGFLSKTYGVERLMPILLAQLGILLASQWMMPRPKTEAASPQSNTKEEKTGLQETLKILKSHSHLQVIALIVITATLASTLLDYQFKELVRGNLTQKAALAGFFGKFYGWTGFLSLFLQIFVTSALLRKAGIGWTLAILPIFLFVGSMGLLIFPSYLLVTGVRGADNTLRKSVHRSALEILYLPVPANLRRKTKTFIDSTLDSVAEGLGAIILFFWVTLAHLPSRALSCFVLVFAAGFFFLARRINRQYYDTLAQRLKEEGGDLERSPVENRFLKEDLLSASFTHLDLQEILREKGIELESDRREVLAPEILPRGIDPVQELLSKDFVRIQRALVTYQDWKSEHVPALLRLLPQDAFCFLVIHTLRRMGEQALGPMKDSLLNEATDFTIRSRIPRALGKIQSPETEAALLEALHANRFEVRYRAAIALVQLRRVWPNRLPSENATEKIWEAIRFEVARSRPVWEMQRLLDPLEEESDGLVEKRLDLRGELSLEHTFRLLTLVHDPVPIRTAFRGILLQDERLKSFALEYLEHILPQDIREKLWPFIGDLGEYQRKKSLRNLQEVAKDLLKTGATLFKDPKEREELEKALILISSK